MVTEQDVRDLLKKYPSPKGHCSIAYHIPISTRNMEIINEMAKYIGSISKRWRGPGWSRLRYDCDKDLAERVSIYPRNENKYRSWFLGKTEESINLEKAEKRNKELADYANKKATEAHKAFWNVQDIKVLLKGSQMCQSLDCVIIGMGRFNTIMEKIDQIVLR